MIRKRLLPVCILGIVFLPAGFALAGGQLYMPSLDPPMISAPHPPVWADEDFPVPYNINPGSAEGSIQGPDPAQQFVDATVAAFDTWAAVPTARLTLERGPDSADLLDTDPDDGINLMVFHRWAVVQGIPIPLPAGVLGVTNVVFDGATGRIRGGAITLNTDPLPGSSGPHWSTSGAPGSLDVEAVMLHEAGHFLGLCHSAVRNDAGGDLSGQPSNAAVMFPFLSHDVMDGRTLHTDDIAWVSYVYPSALYETSFGAVEGDVPFGLTLGACLPPLGVNGAHVVARDLNDLVGGEPRMVVGTYSYRADGPLGRYTIPGLPPGDYGIWIEPLDGSPVAALQINSRIQFTMTTDFPEDWYSGDQESGVESDPGNPATAVPVTVKAGHTVGGIDVIVENTVLPGCISRLGGDRNHLGPWAKAAGNAFFLLPAFFILLLRWRVTAGRRRGPDRQAACDIPDPPLRQGSFSVGR